MYRIVRNLHLAAAICSLPFLLLYGLSAVQMAHNSWFRMKPDVSESVMSVAPGGDDGRAVAHNVMESFGMRGEIAELRTAPAGFIFRIARPGVNYEVEYRRDTGEAKIRTTRAGFLGVLNRLHHVTGFWHEFWVIRLWTLLVIVASCALIMIGGSGLWMWYQRRTERRLGAVLLAVNLGFSLTLLWLIRFA